VADDDAKTEGAGPLGPAEPSSVGAKRRLARILLVLAAVGVFLVLSHNWPRDQTVHVVLGDAAPRVVEVRVAYGSRGEDSSRGASFHFAKGTAPRIVTHEPKLPDGDYMIQIDLATGESKDQHAAIERHVTLQGGTVSIDVSRNVP
jgi:hypothetical protein